MTTYDALRTELKRGGVEAVLTQLVTSLREQKQYHELFEALKMKMRQQLALPLFPGMSSGELSEEQQSALEKSLLEACREVGTLLLSAGKIREGWMYLRPVGDKKAAAELLRQVAADEENTEELIEVCLHEGVDVGRGYQLLLEQYGVCNAITTFDTGLARLPRADQQAAATLLLRRLHADLVGNVSYDITRQEGNPPAEKTLAALVADRDWLLQDGQYHIDTTHLASTVRIARLLSEPADLRLALDLTAYGKRLHTQFQHNGDEPFAEVYPSHALYFQALLNENRDAAVAYFRTKAEELDVSQHGTAPAEVYIDLLARMGQPKEAITEALRLLPAGTQALGIAPSLYELSQQAGDFSQLVASAEERQDLLSFAAGLISQKDKAEK